MGPVFLYVVTKVADTRTYGGGYMVVVQSVLIFRSESWVVIPCILRVLVSLHNRVE